MKTLIVGNGIDIQFGGMDYLPSNIIQRAIENVKQGKYREEDYPKNIIIHLNELFILGMQIIKDRASVLHKVWDEDMEVYDNFRARYKGKVLKSESDIAFEDYFLLQRIYYNLKYNPQIGNADLREKYYEYLRRFFLDSVYNEGKVCYITYPVQLKVFFNQFDYIFSLNYDRNIENLINSKVYYLHGAFHTISEKYNNSSPMNIVMGIHTNTDGHEHLYSTALTTYCGKEKEALLKQADDINKLFKLVPAMQEEAKRTNTSIYPKLDKIFKAYSLNPGYQYPQNYCYDVYNGIKDEITILGLSPSNDEHIIKVIQSNIRKIIYYYYPYSDFKNEIQIVKDMFPAKTIEFKNVVTDLWDKLR